MMKSELAIVGQIWQYNRKEHYFIVSYDGIRKNETGTREYMYTLLPIDSPLGDPSPIVYGTWTKITEMQQFKRVC